MEIILWLPVIVGVITVGYGTVVLRRLIKKNKAPIYNGPWLCEMCYPDHKEIGHIAPTVTIVVDQYGMYSICYGSQGHRDSLYQMQTKPFPNPWEDLTDEEIEASGEAGYKEFCFWEDKARIDEKSFFYWLGCIEACNYLVEELSAGGYRQKEDGYVWHYIFHQAGIIIGEYEAVQV